MLNDPRLLRLFELLVNKNLTSLEPVFAPRQEHWVTYPLLESHLGVDAEYACRLLEDLHRIGYLLRHYSERVFFCPACNSQDLKLTLFCPKCNSLLLTRTRLLKHRACNWTAPADEFLRNDRKICPKCRNELLLLGSDYDDLGNRYRCQDCGEITRAPVERWNCRACGHTYDKWDVRELVLYKYTLNPAQVARLRSEKIPRAKVRELLTREGYEVQESVKMTGRSGAQHQLDILAIKRSGPLEHRVVVGFAAAEEAVDAEEVIKLYAKAYDVSAQDIILIVSPRLSDDAEQFAQHYHIRVYSADKIDQLAAPAEQGT